MAKERKWSEWPELKINWVNEYLISQWQNRSSGKLHASFVGAMAAQHIALVFSGKPGDGFGREIFVKGLVGEGVNLLPALNKEAGLDGRSDGDRRWG